TSENLSQIEELIKTYPYFQGGHILVARAFHQSGNVFADKKIKTAAVYSASRKKLKHFIAANSPNIEDKIVVKEAEVVLSPSTVIENTEKQVVEEIKESSKSLNKEV